MIDNRLVRLALLALFGLALSVSAGCSGKSAAPDPDALKNAMIGKVWQCESLFSREVSGETPLTLEFMPDGTMRGNGGCNAFTGTYVLAGNSITFGPIASTKKSCGAATDEQEYTFFMFLAQINSVKVDGDELELHSPEAAKPMVFGTGGGFLW